MAIEIPESIHVDFDWVSTPPAGTVEFHGHEVFRLPVPGDDWELDEWKAETAERFAARLRTVLMGEG